MTSPKGESTVKQAFVYKDGESKCVDSIVAEEMLADGWFDNPDEVKSELQTLREEKVVRETEDAAKKAPKKTAKKKDK